MSARFRMRHLTLLLLVSATSAVAYAGLGMVLAIGERRGRPGAVEGPAS